MLWSGLASVASPGWGLDVNWRGKGLGCTRDAVRCVRANVHTVGLYAVVLLSVHRVPLPEDTPSEPGNVDVAAAADGGQRESIREIYYDGQKVPIELIWIKVACGHKVKQNMVGHFDLR